MNFMEKLCTKRFGLMYQARHGTRAPTKKKMKELTALSTRLEVLLENMKEQSVNVVPAWLRGWKYPWTRKHKGGELISEGENELYELGIRTREVLLRMESLRKLKGKLKKEKGPDWITVEIAGFLFEKKSVIWRTRNKKLLPSSVSSKILKEALLQQKEIQCEEDDEKKLAEQNPGDKFVLANVQGLKDKDVEEDVDDFDGFSETQSQFGQWDFEDNIDEEDEKLLEAFLSKDDRPQRTLADVIVEKIKEKMIKFQV